jgi:hypothetical protein
MTRSWTDPRTGKRWHIDVVRSAPASREAPGRGGSREAGSALVFESSEGSFALPTADATQLEALEDDRLAELLDAAKDGSDPQEDLRDSEGNETSPEGTRIRGGGHASPSAAGRESQPHRDPPKE